MLYYEELRLSILKLVTRETIQKIKTWYGKESRYPTAVCPLPDEEEITVLESAAKCCGYSLYISHNCKEVWPDFVANHFAQKSPTNLPGGGGEIMRMTSLSPYYLGQWSETLLTPVWGIHPSSTMLHLQLYAILIIKSWTISTWL